MEGIVSKQLDARYSAGRSSSWIKTKHAQGDEFVILGYTAPKRSRTGFGSLLMATRDAGALRYVGRVGTGFDDARLRSLKARMTPLARRPATVSQPAHMPSRPRDTAEELRGGKESVRPCRFRGGPD